MTRICSVLVLVLVLPAGSRARAQDDVCRARRLEAERLQAARAYSEAAELYVRIARDHSSCGRLDEVLYDAALCYEAARLPGRALRVRQILLQNFPQSPLVPRALFQQGAGYHAMALYAEAAAAYEALARRYPAELGQSCSAEERAQSRCLDASVALRNAIFFRLGLHDRAAAEADAQLFARNYGRRMPQLTASIMFSLGAGLEDPDAIAEHAEEVLRAHGEVASLDERSRALVALGRARLTQGRREEGTAALERAIATVTPEAIASLTGAEADVALSRVRSLSALAEAQLRLAELRPVPEIEPPPPYRGPRTAEGFAAWAEGPLAAWRVRQMAALDPLAEAYASIGQHEIPEWSIAAMERTGDLYVRVLRAGEAVAPPAWADRDEALAGAFERARTEALRPVRARALTTYESCARMARVVRWFTERSERCEEGLVALDPARYSTPLELHGEPAFVRDVFGVPPPVRSEPSGTP